MNLNTEINIHMKLMKFITYFKNLNEREQLSLVVGGFFVVLYLFYVLIDAPLTNAVTQKTERLQEQRATLAWMQKVQQQYHQPSSTTTKAINTSQLLALIASELKHEPFKAYPYQLQQTGTGDIQLSFEKVPYTPFMTWLFDITHRYVIHIKEIHLDQESMPKTSGIIKLNLVLSP